MAGVTQLRIPFATLIKIGVAFLLAWVLVKLWPLILIFIVALLIAIVLDPVVVWLERHRLQRRFGVLGLAVVLLLLAAAFCWGLIPIMARQVASLIQQLPQIVHRVEASFPSVTPMLNRLGSMSQPSKTVLNGGFVAGKVALEAVAAIVLVYVVGMYMLLEGRRAYAWLVDFVPARNRRRVDRTCTEVAGVVRSYLRGALITATICASYVAAVLSALHIPLALVLAVLAFIFDFIPVVGTIVMAVPATLLAFLVSPSRAVIVAGAYLLYHGIEAYILIPRIYGRQMRLSTLTVLVAMTIGALLQGAIGAVLSLPIAAAYPIVERIWLRQRLPPDTVELHEELDETQSS